MDLKELAKVSSMASKYEEEISTIKKICNELKVYANAVSNNAIAKRKVGGGAEGKRKRKNNCQSESVQGTV